MVVNPKPRKLKNRLLQLIHERESKIGRRIKQHDIAEFAGVKDHTISAWLHGDITRFDARVVERLCDYFQCDVGDLLYFEESYVDIPEDPDQVD
jgi:DNA-binding Xre family transcriptional regulator